MDTFDLGVLTANENGPVRFDTLPEDAWYRTVNGVIHHSYDKGVTWFNGLPRDETRNAAQKYAPQEPVEITTEIENIPHVKRWFTSFPVKPEELEKVKNNVG